MYIGLMSDQVSGTNTDKLHERARFYHHRWNKNSKAEEAERHIKKWALNMFTR